LYTNIHTNGSEHCMIHLFMTQHTKYTAPYTHLYISILNAAELSMHLHIYSNVLRFRPLIMMATYLVQTKELVQTRANLLNKVLKNSEKNHECDSQVTSSIYKISWSNLSYSRSYKKDKFEMHFNHYCCQKICLFCNF